MKPRLQIQILLLAAAGLAAASSWAGTFLFAENQENPELIAHPTGYTGSENVLDVSVCIATSSESQLELEIPVQNVVGTWNAFAPQLDNVVTSDPDLAINEFDVESVLLHEVGHCIGLAHPNLADESGVPLADRSYAKALTGPNGNYNLDDGTDNVIGTRDDIRGDDINLNWFRIGSNDPFLFESTIDATTYSTDPADLPGGHNFVEIARFEVSAVRGHGDGEAVMFQSTHNKESQRRLHHDDATMLRIGMSGEDRTQGTGDDYTLQLSYGGIDDNCDITIEMTGGGFGVCSVSASPIDFPDNNHWQITEGTITLGSATNIDWYFNSESTGGIIFADRFEQ